MDQKPPHVFKLNDVQLLFVPTNEFRDCFVASVYVYTEPHEPSMETRTAFEKAQIEISTLLLKLAARAVDQIPFPTTAFPCQIRGKGYRLYIGRDISPVERSNSALTGVASYKDNKPWPFGRTYELGWGGVVLRPAERKWAVRFEAVPEST